MMIRLPETSKGETAFDVARRAARVAGAVIMDALPSMTGPLGERRAQVSNKGWNNLVTDIDQAAEVATLAVLQEAFPHFSVLAEESGGTTGSEPYTWYIDPIDGTRNFASGIPHVAVNIALAHQDDLLLGITYDPVREEMFSAVKDGGAWLNEKRMAVSGVESLPESVLGFDMGYVDDKGRMLLEMIAELWPGLQSVRFMGSAALGVAYAAVGRLQLYAHHHVQPWDIAPGILLIQEAGGIATDIVGNEASPDRGSIIAGAPSVHRGFVEATAESAWRSVP